MDHETREILLVLGTGGTREMAERVKAWVLGRPATGMPLENILGLAEAAAYLGVPTKTVAAWVARDLHSFPPPAVTLAATKVWDLAQLEVWASGHPDLLGDRGA